MKIDRMTDLDGASKYGSCTECKKSVTADENAVKITFECGVSIMLCMECWVRMNGKLNRIGMDYVRKRLKEGGKDRDRD